LSVGAKSGGKFSDYLWENLEGKTKVFNFETLMKGFSGVEDFLGDRLDGKTNKIFTPFRDRFISWYEIWCDVF